MCFLLLQENPCLVIFVSYKGCEGPTVRNCNMWDSPCLNKLTNWTHWVLAGPSPVRVPAESANILGIDFFSFFFFFK